MRRAPAEAVVWLLAFIAVRLLVLFGDGDGLLYRIDELYAGAAALELGAGRALPLALQAWDPYSGGSLAVILLAVPVFALLGPSAFALKSIALAISAAKFCVWLVLLERLFDRRAMRLGGLLLVLAPPWSQRLDLMAWGNHAESALPTAAAVLSLAALIRSTDAMPAPGASLQRAFRAGLVAGALAALAVFCSLTGLLAVATVVGLGVLITLAQPRWRPRGRFGAALGAGLATGLAGGLVPWLWLNFSLGFDGFRVLGSSLRPAVGGAAVKLWDLARRQLPDYAAPGLDLPAGLGATLGVALLLALAMQTGRAAWAAARRRPPTTAALVIAPILFLALYAVTGFYIGPASGGVIAFHYLAPITPFLLAGLASGLATIPRGRWRLLDWLPGALALALTLPTAVWVARLVPGLTTTPLHASGASYQAWGWHLFGALDGDLARCVERIEAIPDRDHGAAAVAGLAIGYGIADRTASWAGSPNGRLQRIQNYLDGLAGAGPHRRVFAERLAHILVTGGRLRLDHSDYAALVERVSARSLDEAGPLVSAAIVGLASGGPNTSDQLRAAVDDLPFELQADGWRGVGMVVATTPDARPAPPVSTIAAHATAFVEGYAFQSAWSRLTGPDFRGWAPSATVTSIDADAFRAGVERALFKLEPDDPARRARWSRARLAGVEPRSGASGQ